MLLKKGAQLNIENKWSETPLSLAASQGRIEIYNLFQKNIENSKKILKKDTENPSKQMNESQKTKKSTCEIFTSILGDHNSRIGIGQGHCFC